jgi:DMSO/TMAO reductase YedYZ heme-binding membrane subunit
MAPRRGGFEGGRVLAACAVALGATAALVLAVDGTGEPGLRALIRTTARTSLPLFLAAFLASSLRRLWRRPITAWLLRNRRWLGLSFAVSHAIHLAAIVALATRFPSGFGATSAVTRYGGGLGFVAVALLAATSNDAAVRRLGPSRWRTLHRICVWYLFGIFALSYGPAAFFDPWYAPASAAIFAAAAIRFAAWRTRRAAHTAIEPSAGESESPRDLKIT